jgi:putative ABC transport system substrate-binding protein
MDTFARFGPCARRISRRSFLGRLAAGPALAMLGTGARAQSARKVPRVGFLANTIPLPELEAGTSTHPGYVLFMEGLRSLGWQDGRNIRVVSRSAEEQYHRLPQLAAELVQMGVDVIVAFGPGVDAAVRATKTIPIVMVTYYGPVETGIARSLARPGLNVTGLTVSTGAQQHQRQLSLLKEISPRIRRVAIVSQIRGPLADGLPEVNPRSPYGTAASALGLELFRLSFGDAASLGAVIRSAASQGADALFFDDPPILHYRKHQQLVAREATAHRLPVMFSALTAAANGALMSYGTDFSINYKRSAYYVDRILRGDKPAVIPIEQPSRVEFHLNARAAKAIGLEVPMTLRLRADRVIE